MAHVEFIPDDMPWTDAYKLLIGTIVPRPIAFVSTVSETGVNNLAAFSFFNGVCPRPFILSFAVMRKGNDGSKKDTLVNIEATKCFVVNIVSEDIVAQMNLTAPEYPEDVDEFVESGLTPTPSVSIAAQRVAESPIQMECELVQIVSFGEEPGAGSLVLGRVKRIHLRDDVYESGRIDIERLRPVARLAGDAYSRTTDRFSLKRPTLKSSASSSGQFRIER